MCDLRHVFLSCVLMNTVCLHCIWKLTRRIKSAHEPSDGEITLSIKLEWADEAYSTFNTKDGYIASNLSLTQCRVVIIWTGGHKSLSLSIYITYCNRKQLIGLNLDLWMVCKIYLDTFFPTIGKGLMPVRRL